MTPPRLVWDGYLFVLDTLEVEPLYKFLEGVQAALISLFIPVNMT